MPLLIKCSSPFVAPRHPHLRAPPHVCCHVCHTHARPCLSTGWALNRRFDLTFGTTAMLAQGGGGVPVLPAASFCQQAATMSTYKFTRCAVASPDAPQKPLVCIEHSVGVQSGCK